MAERPIRVLLIEDSEDDAMLVRWALHHGGFAPAIRRVETLGEVRAALAETWDAVVSDYRLPGFTGLEALRAIRDAGLDMPFILSSGAIGEETAAAAMKAGASDYVMKGNLARLAPALERELRDARLRAEHRAGQAALAAAHAELERRVEERTRELWEANRELEAFAHSVSHDLRAPLTIAQRFAAALQDRAAGRLDATSLHYVQRILCAGRRMEAVIDNLLELSRVGRVELSATQVDLTALGEEAAAELREAEPRRRCDLQVQPGMRARGDPGLLRLVVTNLLANAWKFSSKREVAAIRFSELPAGRGQVAFEVRDNGAGFDPAHAERLFGTFERLHSDTEFQGTGIGLAIVRRVIERHGGSVAAEGVPGEGAAFRFSLPAAAPAN